MDQKQRKQERDGEARFALLILLFIIIEVALLVFLLTAHLMPKSWTWGGLQNSEEETSGDATTPEDSQTTQPQPSVPVFSGGVLPARPTANSTTKSLGVEVTSNYAILVDVKTGNILASKNADVRFSPASMTKIMTLIVACENLTEEDLERKLTVTQELYDYARAGNYADSSVAGHDVGDEIRVKDLLYGIGVKSAADCTAMIVHDIRDSEAEFVALMNQKAAEMGLTQTHFDNAIGYDSEENYTTAAEMAMILSYAMQSDMIKRILSVEYHRFEAYYYKDGVYSSFNFTYYSTLFQSRMETYKKNSGKDFSLQSAKLEAGKTGYWDSSSLACQAKALSGGNTYVLVMGDATGSSASLACYFTMKDVKYLLDTYVP
ncbi:MAG: D-alanyl-D-alanine carboxypeptidase [Clostridia bacterium]|nr:D-alanyl-D-alanine carboxypeptidase [Clostridia bacterium]